MGDVLPWTVIVAPPAIVNEIAVAMILHSKVDRCIGIIFGVSFRHTRVECCMGLLPLYPPHSGNAGAIWSSCRDQEGIYQLASIVDAHGLLFQGDNDNLAFELVIVFHQLKIAFMREVIGRLIMAVVHHRLEVREVHLRILDRLLIVSERLRTVYIILCPAANTSVVVFIAKSICCLIIS